MSRALVFLLLLQASCEQAHVDRGRVDSSVTRFPDAREASSRLQQVDPEAARAANAEGDRLARAGKWREALSEYELAIEGDPSLGQAWLNLGWCRLQVGDKKGARDATTHALALVGADDSALGSAYYNLGRIAEDEGAWAEAKEHYRESLHRRPNQQVATRLAKLYTEEEREADADLLGQARPTAGMPVVVSGARSLDHALKTLGLEAKTVTRGARFAFTPRNGGMDVLLASGQRKVVRIFLPRAGDVTVLEEELTRKSPLEWLLVSSAGTWVVEVAGSPRVLLELPVGYRPEPASGARRVEIDVVPEPGIKGLVAGPSGRWRLVEGRFRKLEL
ncbi:MAG: tetratricopeptide repeat protein [Deltaproteobacteria bacterium]|nr:tetratricopeptide repeat protein [Deltaproteobacteria bacterium]